MRAEAKQELLRLAEEHGGRITPAIVLDAARDLQSPLHSEFPENAWDDTAAAEAYRLECARRIIMRVKVEITKPDGGEIVVRGFTSLASDRVDGDGYRLTVQVMQSPDARAELLRTALKELRSLQQKYSQLSELAQIFAALDAAEVKTGS